MFSSLGTYSSEGNRVHAADRPPLSVSLIDVIWHSSASSVNRVDAFVTCTKLQSGITPTATSIKRHLEASVRLDDSYSVRGINIPILFGTPRHFHAVFAKGIVRLLKCKTALVVAASRHLMTPQQDASPHRSTQHPHPSSCL